jgi:MFS family permease
LAAGASVAMLVVFAIVMGVGYGGFIALAPAVIASLYGTRDLGAILGALYTAAAIGGLIGPPLAGEVIDRVSYAAAIVVAMVLTAAATAVLLTLSPTHVSGATTSAPVVPSSGRGPAGGGRVPTDPARPFVGRG